MYILNQYEHFPTISMVFQLYIYFLFYNCMYIINSGSPKHGDYILSKYFRKQFVRAFCSDFIITYIQAGLFIYH